MSEKPYPQTHLEDSKDGIYDINHLDQQPTPRQALEQHAQLKSSLDQLPLWQAMKVYKKTVAICLAAGFCAATDGYQNTIAASIVANKGFINKFGTEHNAKGALILAPTAVSFAGQVLGQFSIQWISDYLGRKNALYAFTLVLTAAALTETFSKVWWNYAIAKLIGGIGIGAVQATLPVFINEHAPNQMRGFLIVAYSLWFTFGGLVASIVLKTHNATSPLDWRLPILTQFAVIGLSFIIFVLLPESPWWLMSKGKTAQAERVLQSKFGKVEGYDIPAEMAIMQATIDQQKEWDAQARLEGPFAIFKGLNAKRFFIGCWPKVLQQFVGLSIFSNYSTYFFQQAGNKDPFLVTVILGCVSLLSVILDALLVDKIGRRRMTLIGFTGACTGVTLIAIVGCFDYAKPSLAGVLVAAGCLANFFNTFQSSTSYAYLTEIPEQRFKARATGWGLAYNNLYAVMFSYTVPLMLKRWNVKTAFLFVCTGIPGTILAYFIMPETMQRSPAEVHELFVTGVPLTKWRGYVTEVEKDLDAREGHAMP